MDTSTINYTFPIYYDVNGEKTPFYNLVLRKVVVDSVVMSLGDKITGEAYYGNNSLLTSMKKDGVNISLYVEYKGVKYYLVDPPTILREGLVSDNSELKGMTKYSFTFYHPMYQLSNMPFTDVAVSTDETKYLSQSGTFSWTGTGIDFIAKLNKNLQGTQWIVVANENDGKSMANLNSLPEEIAPTKAGQEPNSNVLSFDNVMIADALKTCYDTWKVPFVIDQIKEGEAHYSEGKRYLVLFGLPSNEIATATTETVNIDTYLSGGFFCSTTSIELHSGDVITLLSDVSAVVVIEDTMSGNRIPLTDTYKATRNVTVYIGHGGGAISVNIRIASVFIFRMGQGVGLKNNSRNPKNNKIVTRIAGYGSTDNIQYGYPHIIWTGNQSWNYTIDNNPNAPNSYPIYDGYINGQKTRLIQHPFTRDVLMPSIYRDTVNKKVNPLAEGYNPSIEIKDYYDAVNEEGEPAKYPNPINNAAPSYHKQAFDGIKPRLQDQQGHDYGIVKNAVPYEPDWNGYKTFAEWGSFVDTKIAQYRPQIGVYSWAYDIWLGIRSATHTDDPTPARVEAGYWEKIAGSTTASVTITLSGHFFIVKLVSAWENNSWRVLQPNESIDRAWDDTYNTEKDEYTQSYFTVKLPQLNFDLYACASVTQEMKINMRSGACQGCTFPVQVDWDDYKNNFYKEVDGKVVFDPVIHTTEGDGHVRDGSKYPDSSQGQITLLLKKEIETFGTLMPNTYQQPKANDKFVILGISLPQSYVTDAEALLDETMMQYMLENNVHYFDYPLKFDEHFLVTHQDILAQMRNNTIVRFEYPKDGLTNALYIKQMTIKYGDTPLPQYDITLTDDVEIVLNQIGQVTDDVSRMRVQMNELQKYYGDEVIARINEKLSKVADDVAQGRITFQQGLDTIGDAFIHGNIGSPQFETGLYTGRGWRIDNLGNAEMESLRVRSYLEIVELLVNRMQAQEGDTMFSDNDQIEKVDYAYIEYETQSGDNPMSLGLYELSEDGYTYVLTSDTTVIPNKTYYHQDGYILSLKEKWNGYITSQQVGNILKGTINTLAAKQAGISDVTTTDVYYTSWMQVVEVGSSESNTLGVNQIRVVLYGDNQTPAGRNFEPCELMTIARWGSILDPNDPTINPEEEGITQEEKDRRLGEVARRKSLQSSFYISTTEGRIVKLTGVNAPILKNGNYGTTLGIVPDFVKNWSIANRLIDGRDYLYAQGVIVGDFIKVDIEGNPLINYVDCGEWVNGADILEPTAGHGVYYVNEYNDVTLQYETHEVWHNGALWRVKMHQPVTMGGVEHYYEPTDNNYAYWQKLMASGDSTQNIYYRGNGTPDTPTGDAPQGWTTYPQGVSQSLKNEYISTRIKSDGTWGSWSTPALFAHYAEDGTSISITGSALKHYNTWAAFENDATKVVGKTYIVDENDSDEPQPCIVVWGSGEVDIANVGDAYLVQEDGHLYHADSSNTPWNDLGQIKGDKGDNGDSNATVFIYKRSASQPADSDKPTDALTYSFTNGSLSGNLNGWSAIIPQSDGNPCWVRQVFVSSDSPTVTIAPTSWSTANKYTEDGKDGVSFEAQYAPNDNPTSSQIHNTWQTGDLYMRTRATNASWSNWQRIVGENGENGDYTDYSFGISALLETASPTTPPSDISTWADAPIETTELKPYLWSKVIKYIWVNGVKTTDSTTYIRLTGDKGDNGKNTSVVFIYKRATSITNSDKPSGTSTYDFGNGSLTGTLNGWSTSIPANTNGLPCWVRQVFASSESQTTTIAESAWSAAKKLIEDGKDGNSIKIEGQHADYLFSEDAQGQARPQASASTLGKIDLLDYEQGDSDMIDVVEFFSGEYSWEAYTVPFGTCYIFNDHLYEATEQGWVDLGKFKGDDAVVYEIVFEKNIFVLNPNTNKVRVDVKGKAYKIEGETRTGVTLSLNNLTLRKVMDFSPEREALLPLIFSQNTFTCTDEATYTSEKLLKAVLRIDNTDVAIESTPLVTDGRTGERGKVGRFYYYSGFDWDASNETDAFVVNDAQVPYFSKAGSNSDKYYVFNPETIPAGGVMTMAQMAEATTESGAIQWNKAPWEVMTDDFKYLITQAIFGAYAHLGSWIFNNDYMLSEKDKDGVPRGQRVYNGMDDNQLTTGFIPSIAFDALNGRASFGGDTVRFQPDGAGWLANKSIIWDEDGNASFSGFIKKTPTYITQENESEYLIKYFGDLYTFDIQKTGTFVIIQNGVQPASFDFPCLYQNVAHYYSDEQKMIIRGYVGTKFLLYNLSGHALNITYMYNSGGQNYNTSLGNGACATLECKIREESGYENVCWEFVRCGSII